MTRHNTLLFVGLVAWLCPTARSYENEKTSDSPLVESHLRSLTTHGLDKLGYVAPARQRSGR